jgi:hypothetical protein
MAELNWTTPDPDSTFNQVQIYRASSKYGTYSLLTTLSNIRTTKYNDLTGTASSWYKIRFKDSTNTVYSAYSTPIPATGVISDINYTTPRKVAFHLNWYRTVTAEAVGTGNGTTTVFGPVADPKVIEDTETVYVAGTEKIRNVDYTVDYDTGKITFTTAPANAAAITADYWASTVCINSRVIDAIQRAEDEVNRKLRKTFYYPQQVTEYLDSYDPIDSTPYTFEATTFSDTVFEYRPQMNNALYSRAIKLEKYPVTEFYQIIINAQPTAVSAEAVGTGAGVETVFPLGYSPVVYGSEVVYVGGTQTTGYTMNYTTGTITFTNAPTGAITCDYTHCNGGTALSSSDYLVRYDSGLLLFKGTVAQIKQFPFVCAVTYKYGYESVPGLVEHQCTLIAMVELMTSTVLGAPQAQDTDRNNIRSIQREIELVYDALGRVMDVTRI